MAAVLPFKYKTVPATTVPPKPASAVFAMWTNFFSKVSKDEAIEIPHANGELVKGALRRQKEKGLYLNLSTRTNKEKTLMWVYWNDTAKKKREKK